MTMSTNSFSRDDIVLVRDPFSDLSGARIRPAVVVTAAHPSDDVPITPLTSRITGLLPGEFVPADWKGGGLHVATAVRRGVYTAHRKLVVQRIGKLAKSDRLGLDPALRGWLDL